MARAAQRPPFGFVSELWSAVSTAIDKARLSCFIFAQPDWLNANTRWQRWRHDWSGRIGTVRGRLMKLLKWTALLLAVVIVTLFAVRVYISQSGAPLEPWHTFVPHEMKAKAIDGASWAIISGPKTRFSRMCCMK